MGACCRAAESMSHKVKFVESRYMELQVYASCVSHHSNRTLYSVSRRTYVGYSIISTFYIQLVLIHYHSTTARDLSLHWGVNLRLKWRSAAPTIPRSGRAGRLGSGGVTSLPSGPGVQDRRLLPYVPDSCIALEMTERCL